MFISTFSPRVQSLIEEYSLKVYSAMPASMSTVASKIHLSQNGTMSCSMALGKKSRLGDNKDKLIKSHSIFS